MFTCSIPNTNFNDGTFSVPSFTWPTHASYKFVCVTSCNFNSILLLLVATNYLTLSWVFFTIFIHRSMSISFRINWSHVPSHSVAINRYRWRKQQVNYFFQLLSRRMPVDLESDGHKLNNSPERSCWQINECQFRESTRSTFFISHNFQRKLWSSRATRSQGVERIHVWNEIA